MPVRFCSLLRAGMAELADAVDSKSTAPKGRASSSLAPGINTNVSSMPRSTAKMHSKPPVTYPVRKGEDRATIWEKAQGMWKNRKPDPIKELRKIRKEWERNPL